MSAKEISALTKEIAGEVASAGADIGNSDPELWEHLFADGIIDGIKACAPSSSPAETAAFRGLYAQIKIVIDQALVPSDLVEASYVIKYQVSGALQAIAKKDKTVGAEILADLSNSYRQHPDRYLRSFAKAAGRKIEALAGGAPGATAAFTDAAEAPSVSSPPAAETGNPALAGKTVVFTGTLSVTRKEAATIAEGLGLRVSNAVSKKTDYLVAGEDAGQKIAKAAAQGVTVLSEQQWHCLITSAPSPHATTRDVTILQPFRFKT